MDLEHFQTSSFSIIIFFFLLSFTADVFFTFSLAVDLHGFRTPSCIFLAESEESTTPRRNPLPSAHLEVAATPIHETLRIVEHTVGGAVIGQAQDDTVRTFKTYSVWD